MRVPYNFIAGTPETLYDYLNEQWLYRKLVANIPEYLLRTPEEALREGSRNMLQDLLKHIAVKKTMWDHQNPLRVPLKHIADTLEQAAGTL